jgi:hypothetical protein
MVKQVMGNLSLALGHFAVGVPPADHAPCVQGSGFRVQGSGFRVQGSGFRVQGSGFRVSPSDAASEFPPLIMPPVHVPVETHN